MAARLGYAVAFEAVRDVLVLDEIFAVGDAGFRATCEERYRELRSAGHAVIIVSHAPPVIRQFWRPRDSAGTRSNFLRGPSRSCG
jgi:ABC-type polysaccharide/polyol phosphate transport system ATPase subunit